jgi:hypothetical protein
MSSTEFAKTHLRQHLVGLIVPPVSDGFWSIYDSAKELSERNGQLDQVLRTFQNMLTKIPEWSEATLSEEVQRIVKITKCTYMDDLLMGVFISYMRSFASLHYRGSSSEIKIDFNRPSFEKFVHELYKHSGRKLWQVAYYFKTLITLLNTGTYGIAVEGRTDGRYQVFLDGNGETDDKKEHKETIKLIPKNYLRCYHSFLST